MQDHMVGLEIKSHLSRKKLNRTNQNSNFLGGAFSNYSHNLFDKKNTIATS